MMNTGRDHGDPPSGQLQTGGATVLSQVGSVLSGGATVLRLFLWQPTAVVESQPAG